MIAMCAIAGGANAQTVNGPTATVNFTGMDKAGATVSMVRKAENGITSEMKLTGTGKGTIDIGVSGASTYTLNLFAGGSKVYTGAVRGGPAPIEWEPNAGEFPVYTATLSAEEDWVWLVVGAIIYLANCYTDTETCINGVCTTTSGWDCGGNGITVQVGGQQYANVTRMELVSTGNSSGAATSRTFTATGGARITSAR